MKNSVFEKYGDRLLFALAIGVLATLVVLSLGNMISSRTATPGIVFTQWWQEGPEKETLAALVEEFERLHGDIKIVLNTRPYEDLRLDLFNPAHIAETQASFGDLIALDPLWVGGLLERGVIEPTEKTGEALLSFINVLYYNIDVLKDAGFSIPPKNRGEFLTQARAVTLLSDGSAENKRWALALGMNNSRGIYDDLYPWIWAAGAQLLRDGIPNVNSRPVIESLSFFASLNTESLIAPGAFSADSEKKLEDFISGRAVFVIAPAREIRHVRQRMGDEAFGITSIPLPDNYVGRTFFASAGWTVGVHSGSGQKEAARLFADFLAARADFLLDRARALPQTVFSPHAPDPFYSKVWDISLAGEAAQDFSGLSGVYELEEIFREELTALFEGQAPPAAAAEAIQKRWEAQLVTH